MPDLKLCHRRRARCENRIRIAKDTGARNLPSLHDFTQNLTWLAMAAMAAMAALVAEITDWDTDPDQPRRGR